jgi:hypothetical protein
VLFTLNSLHFEAEQPLNPGAARTTNVSLLYIVGGLQSTILKEEEELKIDLLIDPP